MSDITPRIGSLFSGAGGLDLAVLEVFGGEVVWHAEIDKAASKVLAQRFPGVPNLGDISAVDWAEVPAVDVLCGGFPCQDVSAAGKRAGIKAGTRSGLWSMFADAIDALRPQWVVIENVRGLLSAEATRSEVNDQQPCVCGWLDRWRRFSGSGLPEAGESAGSLELLRLGDHRDDRTGEADSGVDSPGVGRVASSAQGGGREGMSGVAVAGVGRQGAGDSADAVAALEVKSTASASCAGSGADSGEPTEDEQWRCGVDIAVACRVRDDQTEGSWPERQGSRCEECGGFLPSGSPDSGVESPDATLGNGSDGPVLRAAGAVCADLADLGYDAQWATVAAADVGAPHRRERVFIVASDTSGDGRGWREERHLEPSTGDEASQWDNTDRRVLADGWNQRCANVSGDQLGVALLPTPCVVDRLATTDMTLEQWDESRRSQKERGVGSFGPRGDSLGAAILRVEEGGERPDYSTTKARRGGDEFSLEDAVALLPTPAAGNFNDGEDAQQWLERQAAVKERLNNGNGMGMPLSVAVQLLPTPRSSDCFGAGQHGDGGMDLRTTISLLPTPTVGDGTGGGRRSSTRDGKDTHNDSLRDAVNLAQTQWGKYAPAIARWEAIVGPAPAPTEPNKNGNPRLSAAFSEWLMGWPQGWVTHPDIGISRNDQLRIIGNGVCPQQAIAALHFLLAVANSEVTR